MLVVVDHTAAHFVKNVTFCIVVFQRALQGGVFRQRGKGHIAIGIAENKMEHIRAGSHLGHRQKPTAEQGKIALLRQHICQCRI